MRCQTATNSAFLPVTAVCIVQATSYLLVGEGGFLHLYSLRTNELFETVRVFDGQGIHHIEVSSYHSDDCERQILVSGGSLIGFLTLCLSKSRHLSPPHIYNANDWILRVRHHGLGSSDGIFALVTANNSLLSFDTLCPPMPAGHGPKTFLYSADVCSPSHDTMIVAGGSAFGEIVVWSCHQDRLTSSDWTSTSLYRIPAHNGSIFGICISPLIHIGSIPTRLIVSCSDDRQIQVRQLGLISAHQTSPNAELIQDTGFGHANNVDNDHRLVASTWAHQSRIWDVDFVSTSEIGEETSVKLTSIGEDATCQTWQLKIRRDSSNDNLLGQMSLMCVDRHHSGKNIWSFVHQDAQADIIVVSGGADGSLVKRSTSFLSKGAGKIISVPFCRIGVISTNPALKDYMILNERQVLSLTSSGDLLLHQYRHESASTWKVIESPSGSRVVKLCANCPPGIAIVAVEKGIGVWRPDQGLELIETNFPFAPSVTSLHLAGMESIQLIQHTTVYLVASIAGPSTAIFLRLHISASEVSLTSAQLLYLPKGCIATTSYFSLVDNTLMVGFRSGGVAFFHISNDFSGDINDSVYFSDIHGSDAVTSLQPLRQQAINENGWLIHIVTTGRDGSYAIHELTIGPRIGCQLITVHRSSPPLGPNLEGAHIDAERNQILLFGFRSTNFVVWNETEQYTLSTVNCGGAHRSWDFRTDTTQQGTFVWTKAGSFNLASTAGDKPELICQGGHGREIKAAAVFPDTLSSSQLGQYYLVASGAEDTEIRLFAALAAGKSGKLRWKTLAVLHGHTTGLQHLAFSANKRYLVSAGGAEQLYVWHLSLGVPWIEVGVVLQGKMPRADDDADVRIMDFQILNDMENPNNGDSGTLDIAAAYSNGKVKIIQYQEGGMSGQGSFQTRREIRFGSFCLTQINFHDFGDPHRGIIIAAGTNGYLNQCNLESLQCGWAVSDMPNSQKVHQSSIQCLQVLEVQPNLQVVASGGDDSALGFTLQRASASDAGQQDSHTLLIPRAHAAALTALEVLTSGVITSSDASPKFQAIVVTAGNDQKMKVWQVEIPHEADGNGLYSMETLISKMKVRRIHETWTFVADIGIITKLRSDIESGGEMAFELMVVGVGMEVLRLKLP